MVHSALLLALGVSECQTEPGYMISKELSEREELILQAVVHTYVTTAEPVGSRTIVKRFDLDLSAASVRNVMADLEESGYLQQLHASSGRVPTDHGYRYYVDYLMRVQELTTGERSRIERELSRQLEDADEIMRQTSHMLALVSHQTGIVEGPPDSNARIRRIELMLISSGRLAVLVVDNYGRVRTNIVTVDDSFNPDQLRRLTGFLNDQCMDLALDGAADAISSKLQTYLDSERWLAEHALQVLNLLPPERPGQLFLDGAIQLFEHPEFRDVAKAREVFNLLDERDRLVELLRAGTAEGEHPRASIVIGSEAAKSGLDGISVITSPYFIDDQRAGVLGILGPRRMPYSRLTAIVDYTAGALTRFLTRLAH